MKEKGELQKRKNNLLILVDHAGVAFFLSILNLYPSLSIYHFILFEDYVPEKEVIGLLSDITSTATCVL